jgi:hypothetical protein
VDGSRQHPSLAYRASSSGTLIVAYCSTPSQSSDHGTRIAANSSCAHPQAVTERKKGLQVGNPCRIIHGNSGEKLCGYGVVPLSQLISTCFECCGDRALFRISLGCPQSSDNSSIVKVRRIDRDVLVEPVIGHHPSCEAESLATICASAAVRTRFQILHGWVSSLLQVRFSLSCTVEFGINAKLSSSRSFAAEPLHVKPVKGAVFFQLQQCLVNRFA